MALAARVMAAGSVMPWTSTHTTRGWTGRRFFAVTGTCLPAESYRKLRSRRYLPAGGSAGGSPQQAAPHPDQGEGANGSPQQAAPHPDEGEGANDDEEETSAPLPLDNYLWDMIHNRYLIQDIAGKWLSTPVPVSTFEILLAELGIAKRGWDAAKSRVRGFTRMMPVYEDPDKDYLIYEDQWTFNTYVKPELQPAAGNWDDIHALLMNLVGNDPDGFAFFLQWLAAPIQAVRRTPGGNFLKMGTAVVLHGDEGGGKNTLHSILKLIYGPSNVGLIGQGSLDSQFNTEILNKLFISANEVMSSTNKGAEAANKLKMWVTDDEMPVEGKHVETKLARNTFNIMFFSNNENPVLIGPTDRRFSVFKSGVLDKAVGARLNVDIKGARSQVAAFLEHLLALPIAITYGSLHENGARAEVQQAQLASEVKFLCELRRDGWLAISLPWVQAGNPQNQRQALVSGDNVASSVLKEVYQFWCNKEGIKPRAASNLWPALKKEFPNARDARPRQGGVQVRAWTGLPMHAEETKVVAFPAKEGEGSGEPVASASNG